MLGWRSAGKQPVRQFIAERPINWEGVGQYLICLDWTVAGLSRHSVRRWLVLDANGFPLPEQPLYPWKELNQLIETDLGENDDEIIESALDKIHGWLLEDERARLAPLLDELRHNVQRSWMQRIDREREQIIAATYREQHGGNPVDIRWRRMKQGLIARLTTELDERILHLEKIREGVQAELTSPIIVKLKDQTLAPENLE
jgi:hypothetical protein